VTFRAEDHRDFVRLTEGAIGVQQAFSHLIQSGAAVEIKLSQSSTWAKNNRCWHPACLRSFSVKKGVKAASHF